jgi:hypothetical protein
MVMSNQVQGARYSESEMVTIVAVLELVTSVTALKLEMDVAPLELEMDVSPLELEMETGVSQEISKKDRYSAN